jgi:hypothetical protein
MTNQNKRVAVIGAGVSGAACAQQLAQAGCFVTVFDKSRGVSGRLSTRRTDLAHYDHGAQYFTAQSNEFKAQVNDWQQRGIVAQWQPRVANPDVQQWFVGTPDMPSVVRDMIQTIDLQVNTRIESVEQVDSEAASKTWQLITDKGTLFNGFTDLVVAVPPAQAVPLVQNLAPSMVSVLNAIDMLPCLTVMITTSDPVTTSLPIDAERVADHPALVWWARNDSKPGRVKHAGQASWVIQATPEWTLTHLDADPADVIRLLCDAFWRHVGVKTLPQVQQSMAHRWLYSRRHLEPKSTQDCLWAANVRLGVCGDGLVHSRIESAYLSGVHMANAVLS